MKKDLLPNTVWSYWKNYLHTDRVNATRANAYMVNVTRVGATRVGDTRENVTRVNATRIGSTSVSVTNHRFFVRVSDSVGHVFLGVIFIL